MMFTVKSGLPFVSVDVVANGQRITVDNILLDTGSAGTIFSADILADIGLVLEPNDTLRQIYGIGGSEFVFEKSVDQICLGELVVSNFIIELGALDYGFNLHGIIGSNFLYQTGAHIDFSALSIS